MDPKLRENMRRWRTSGPLDLFHGIRKKFNDAGIDIYSTMFNFSDDLSEPEIDTAFEFGEGARRESPDGELHCAIDQARGPFAESTRCTWPLTARMRPFDPNTDGMVFANNLLDALKWSPYMRITLDVGHFMACGGDGLSFLREHHDKIANLRLKDRLKNHPGSASGREHHGMGQG